MPNRLVREWFYILPVGFRAWSALGLPENPTGYSTIFCSARVKSSAVSIIQSSGIQLDLPQSNLRLASGELLDIQHLESGLWGKQGIPLASDTRSPAAVPLLPIRGEVFPSTRGLGNLGRRHLDGKSHLHALDRYGTNIIVEPRQCCKGLRTACPFDSISKTS